MIMDTPILIIGAGPAGLAMAAQLEEASLDYTLLERTKQVGSSWRSHYDRLHLHTVKELSSLPGLSFDAASPKYIPRAQVVEYLESYARHFGIQPVFEQEVNRIWRTNGHWLVKTQDRQYKSPKVILASGVNRIPKRPDFPGEDTFTGKIIHSRAYKNPLPFTGQKVLVVGMGNTGAEIALDLCEAGISVSLAVRSPVNIVPRDFARRSTQKTALRLAQLPTWLGDRLGLLMRHFTMGDLPKYGLPLAKVPPARQLREAGKTPVVDIGTADQIRKGNIQLKPGIDCFSSGYVQFSNGEKEAFDAVILATGYRPGLEALLDRPDGLLDSNQCPREVIGSGHFEGLYFLGFDNYTPGGILGVIRRDVKLIVGHLMEHLPSTGNLR